MYDEEEPKKLPSAPSTAEKKQQAKERREAFVKGMLEEGKLPRKEELEAVLEETLEAEGPEHLKEAEKMLVALKDSMDGPTRQALEKAEKILNEQNWDGKEKCKE